MPYVEGSLLEPTCVLGLASNLFNHSVRCFVYLLAVGSYSVLFWQSENEVAAILVSATDYSGWG